MADPSAGEIPPSDENTFPAASRRRGALPSLQPENQPSLGDSAMTNGAPASRRRAPRSSSSTPVPADETG